MAAQNGQDYYIPKSCKDLIQSFNKEIKLPPNIYHATKYLKEYINKERLNNKSFIILQKMKNTTQRMC